jgi:predicted acylesterase/phospholipase RssA
VIYITVSELERWYHYRRPSKKGNEKAVVNGGNMLTRRSFLGATGAGVGSAIAPLSARAQATIGPINQPPVTIGPINQPPIPINPGPIVVPRVAIVLAGGGAKGSFEVGAVRYLYDQGIRPDILCGTSVGAINAAKLAEGEGDPTQGLPGLESIWLGLKQNSDMYEHEPWLDTLKSTNPDLYAALPSFVLSSDPDPVPGVHVTATNVGTAIPTHSLFAALAGPIRLQAWIIEKANQGVTCFNDCQTLQWIQQQSPKAFYNLNPIMSLLERRLSLSLVQQWAGGGGKLRLATCALESGKVRYVTEAGQLLDRDTSTVVYTIPPAQGADAPACRPVLVDLGNIEQQIRALGPSPAPPLPGAAPSEAYGEWLAKYKPLAIQFQQTQQQLEICRQSNRPAFIPEIRPGVLASAALPSFFLPVKLGSENYVDGGIRDVMPVEIAAKLGATTIYAVNDSPPLGCDTSYDDKNLLDIGLRALTGIAVDEVVHEAETVVPNASQVQFKEIRCTYAEDDDTVMVHPALIRINMSYGYMRAADSVKPVAIIPDRCYQLADDITKFRRILFDFERRVNNTDVEDRKLSVPMLRWAKGMLYLLILERLNLGGAIPPDVLNSWLTWEQHSWPVAAPSPFSAITPVPEDHNAADFIPQDGTLLREAGTDPIYVILGGAKFHIPTPEALLAMGLSSRPIQTVPVGSLGPGNPSACKPSAGLLASVPWEGKLIKELAAAAVYWIQNGMKRWIVDPTAMSNHGFSWASVLVAPDGSLASIPNGPQLTE